MRCSPTPTQSSRVHAGRNAAASPCAPAPEERTGAIDGARVGTAAAPQTHEEERRIHAEFSACHGEEQYRPLLAGFYAAWGTFNEQFFGGRLRQLVWNGATTTCAAFSPHTDSSQGFLVTGTRDGRVVVWPVPRSDDLNKAVTARITAIGEALTPATRDVLIQAELSDKPAGIVSGNSATLVIPQVQPHLERSNKNRNPGGS